MDVSSDSSKPEIWQKAFAFRLPENGDINGPIDAILKTLKTLLFSYIRASYIQCSKNENCPIDRPVRKQNQ